MRADDVRVGKSTVLMKHTFTGANHLIDQIYERQRPMSLVSSVGLTLRSMSASSLRKMELGMMRVLSAVSQNKT